jgi:hypothetical protein
MHPLSHRRVNLRVHDLVVPVVDLANTENAPVAMVVIGAFAMECGQPDGVGGKLTRVADVLGRAGLTGFDLGGDNRWARKYL